MKTDVSVFVRLGYNMSDWLGGKKLKRMKWRSVHNDVEGNSVVFRRCSAHWRRNMSEVWFR